MSNPIFLKWITFFISIFLLFIIRNILPSDITNNKFSLTDNRQQITVDNKVFAKESKNRLKGKININRANKKELMMLPGIGKEIAKRIIRFRKEKGFFKNKGDIMEVKGIGKKRYEAISNYIVTFGKTTLRIEYIH